LQMTNLADAFAKAGMKSGMDGVDPVVEYEDTEEIDVVGIGCNETVRAMLKEMDIPLLETGVIRGMNAGILSEATRRGLGTMSIMVEADPRFPDARAAAALIEKLNTLLPAIDLPQEPLLAEAEMLEAQLQALMESAGGASKPSPSSNAMLYG
ncbi:MAG: PAC2 family protein, partial [Poseidonia sp.]